MTEVNNTDFLKQLLSVDNDVRKMVPMKRFGLDFEIKALSTEEATKIQQRATKLGNKGAKIIDEEKFNYLTIAKACVQPNWDEVAEAMEVVDAMDAIKERLLFGEVAYLLGEIAELNGFDKDDEELIGDIKN